MADDECARVIHENLLRHAAEGLECALEACEPALLPLMSECPHVNTSRVTERCHEHKSLDLLSPDLDQALAEVDLKLSAGRCLEPRGRERLCLQCLPVLPKGSLQGPKADGDGLLGLEVLANHIGVPAMTQKPLAQPLLMPVQRLAPFHCLERQGPVRRQIMLHGVMA